MTPSDVEEIDKLADKIYITSTVENLAEMSDRLERLFAANTITKEYIDYVKSMPADKYEAMLVFSVVNGEEATTALVEKFKALIAENGTVENVDDWGKRRLAYLINDEAEGHYVITTFTAGAEFPAELERVAKITDGVLRTMIIKK